jgi:hypothetical protein
LGKLMEVTTLSKVIMSSCSFVMVTWSNAVCDSQVHGDYKEDVGTKLERPADTDEAMAGQEVAAAEWW